MNTNRQGRLRTGVLLVLLVGALLGFLVWFSKPSDPEIIIRSARRMIFDGKATEALATIEPLIAGEPADGNACFLAGEALSELENFPSAVEMFSRVPVQHSKRAEACFRAGDIFLLQLYRLSEAEKFLIEALTLKPDHQASQAHLAGLYGLCGLTSLTTKLRFERLHSGKFTEVDLVLLALGDTASENAAGLEKYLKTSPDDPLTQLASAHQLWQQNEFSSAGVCYEQGLSFRPDLSDAQSRLGRILIEQNAVDEFLKWHAKLSTTAAESAEIWAVCGDWSLRQKDLRGAVRCYWEAARRDPTHRRAHHQLGQTLASLGETTAAESFQRRNESLQELLLAAKQCNLGPTPAGIIRTIEAASQCGHDWEAWGWAEAFRRQFPQQSEAVGQIFRPSVGTPRVNNDAQPALLTNYTDYPMPEWMNLTDRRERAPKNSSGDSVPSELSIRFTNDAERAGLNFEFIHGDELPGPGMRMFQFSGGGTGVLDYDCDGWPDVYLTQGSRWPSSDDPEPSDVLFRNHRGYSFQNSSVAAGIHETSYSQGLAVGDINGDGFSDVFVANVSRNRLFRNNGDGTFEDITESAGVSDIAWSTSAVCADFNGDGWPDIYVVNYLEGEDLLDRICRRSDGSPRACTPHEFEPAEDQLLLNLGDGRFQDVSAESGIFAPGGKGLGVIAADFDDSGRLSLFVGNDTTANFFFHNQTTMSGEIPRFEESAVVHGLAFDREGRTQACMGIAAGDADSDGALDLFVTNYFNESNTLYQRYSGLMFSDTTAESSLRDPSIKQLGFGTQFLDADLDGWLDLVVTNGHVDDETARDIPLHMPTQFYHNDGAAKFSEVPASHLGTWFEGKYLGRGLARLDWNRDGLEDFLVGLLEAPTALLTNESKPQGNHITLKLISASTAREAIGATVQVKTHTGSVSKQLTAGDGYQASNERQLIFAVADNSTVDVMIQWPSRQTDQYRSVPAGKNFVAIEGRDRLSILP